MKKTVRAVALLLSMVMIFSACKQTSTLSEKSTTGKNEEITVTDVTKKTIQENGDRLEVQASYPETKAANINTIIVSEVRKNINAFKKQANSYLAKHDVTCTMHMDYEIYPVEENVFSVCYTISAAIGDTVQKDAFARTYNLAEDGLYSIKDFFPAGDTSFLQTLAKEVRTNAEKGNLLGENPDITLLEKGTKAAEGLFSSFMYMKDKFAFVFPRGQIAAQSVQVDVPVTALEGKVQMGVPSIKEFKQLEEIENIRTDAQPETTTEGGSNETTTGNGEEPVTGGNTDTSKKIALTFDDGPGPYTDSILDALKEVNGKATFFMVGTSIKAYPEQVKHVHEAGCEIGNHTYSHQTLTKISDEKIQSQVGQVQDLIEQLTGERPKLLRPPGGSRNEHVRKLVNMPFILWNLDTEDWKHRDADYVYNYTMKKVAKGDIILMHDIHKTSAQAAVRLIKDLTAQGYELVTISELFEAYGPDLVKGESFYAVTGNTWK